MSMSEGGDEDDGCEGGRDSIVIRCEGEGTWLAATTCVEAGGSTGVAEDEEGEEGCRCTRSRLSLSSARFTPIFLSGSHPPTRTLQEDLEVTWETP